MFYLISQIFVCLLIAALLGAWLGWWLRGSRSREEVEQLRGSMQQTFDNERRGLLARIDEADRKASVAESELEDLKTRLEAVEGEKSKIEAELKTTIDDKSKIEAELAASPTAEKLSSLQSALDKASQNAEDAERRAGSLGTELEQCRADASTTEAEIAGLRSDLEACKNKRTDLEAQLAATAGGAASGLLSASKPEKPDDLKKVEGIGKKIEGLLNTDGIWTWRALAAATTDRLQGILDAAGPRYRIHDPGTWPDQARLAADGEWEILKELQDRLKGGREA